jgi:site-specific DNA-methyltransferase (adenine-specific)
MDTLKTNVLYYGDNLEILRKYIPENSIDLVYLDPPFNSKKDYNILFKENGGVESEAQIKAFTDTWHWTQTAENTYHDIVTNGPLKVGRLIGALHDSIGQNDVMAYLVMMTTRLTELHRVLKSTGSLYLHCDPTASHYLKLVLDQIFEPANFRNEIVWKRTSAHNDPGRYGANIDTIFFYTKTNNWTWNQIYRPHSQEYSARFRHKDSNGRSWSDYDLTAKGLSGGGYEYEYKGVKSLWRCPIETMQQLDAEGKLHFTKAGGIRLKRYLDETKGTVLQCLWEDVPPINSQAKERLGYETQKPLPLLERIIRASSNEGDIVLDPFCGCGTALVAAQKLNRRWIGIDITHLAITLMRNRLRDSFPGIQFEVIGEPADLASARALARQDRYQFQWWALGLIKARPLGEKKKGADKGIDGIIQFIDDPSGKPKRAVVQVKSGHVAVNAVRELTAVAAKDALGIFIALEPPTGPMQTEAVSAGFYHSPGWNKDYPKIQILTIEELLHGKAVDMPPQTQTNVTFAKAPKVSKKAGEQLAMK